MLLMKLQRSLFALGLVGLCASIVLDVFPVQPASATDDPVIAAAGDIACDPIDSGFHGGVGTPSRCHEMYTGAELAGGAFAAVLPLGDEQYECGGTAAFEQSYDPAWGVPAVKSISYPVVGNHEYNTSGGTDCGKNASGYFGYFGAAAGDPTKGYYSYDIGTWHLIALNANCGHVACKAGSAQETWLANDLATHPNTCTLAYFHQPLFSAGPTTNSAVRPTTARVPDGTCPEPPRASRTYSSPAPPPGLPMKRSFPRLPFRVSPKKPPKMPLFSAPRGCKRKLM